MRESLRSLEMINSTPISSYGDFRRGMIHRDGGRYAYRPGTASEFISDAGASESSCASGTG